MTILAESTLIDPIYTYPGEQMNWAGSTSKTLSTFDRAGAGVAIFGAEPDDPSCVVVASRLRVTDPVSVNEYRLVSRLGTGGMGDVFYAIAPTGDPVAVKVLRGAAWAPETCQREYELARAVDADCTAPALDYGVSAAGAYLVTAYLPGFRCGDTLVDRPMSAGRIWTLGSALAGVLAAVHARGVVHCDVKPANLLVRGRDVRVIDFGIARYVGERCGVDGVVECSRGWASPEQLRTAPAVPAVDVFAWGCIIAYLACGVHPFVSQDDDDWIRRIESAEADLFDVPSGLDTVIRSTLARDPRDRPTADELIAICSTGGPGRP
jgi:serine/threonine protein kinase